jgi:hypothetical protein
MNKKWNMHRKGYLKVHIAVDIKSKKFLSMRLTDEHIHDSKMLKTLIDKVSISLSDKKNNRKKTIRIKSVLADGVFNKLSIFIWIYIHSYNMIFLRCKTDAK